MNTNKCIFCGAIIPEGKQVCYKCENMSFGAYSVTPENKFCANCEEECNGECEEFLALQKSLIESRRKRKIHKKQQKKGV